MMKATVAALAVFSCMVAPTPIESVGAQPADDATLLHRAAHAGDAVHIGAGP